MATLEDPRSSEEDRIPVLEATLEALRQESEVAHVLLGLAGALAEVRTVEETLDRTVRVVPELFGARHCLVAAWNRVTETFEVTASAGYKDGAEVAQPRLLRAAVENHAPVLVPDASADDRFGPGASPGACIAIPLSRWGERFGALQISFPERRPFSSKDEALARGIAGQLGVALANARRFNLLRDLRAFGLRVGSKLRLEAVVSEVSVGASELLSGDGAALYFLDASSSSLVLAGSSSLSPATAEGLNRIELGVEPWAGLITTTMLPVSDLRRATGDERVPLSAVGVPVPAPDGNLVGALVVFFERSIRVGADEAEALSVFAAQSGTALMNAQRFERQRRVARSLQQGLLSIEVPPLADWEVGAVYEPAGGEAEVGGDFFDVFEVSDGGLALSVGDVSGKGAEAAASTAMAKYMLRAFAMRNPAPASVLYHLNKALVQSFDDDRFTTLFYALLDPAGGQLRLAVGGHPAPLVYRAASGAVEVHEPAGSILGAFEGQRFEEAVVDLARGDVLLAYTDGLAEARRGDALYGREEIAASLASHSPSARSAQELARLVFEDAREFGSIVDDTVVFALASDRQESAGRARPDRKESAGRARPDRGHRSDQ